MDWRHDDTRPLGRMNETLKTFVLWCALVGGAFMIYAQIA